MNTSPENLGIGGKGIGFYFLIKDATKRHGLESYFLFQDKTNLKLYKATPNATGKVGVAAEKASFPASTGTAKIFNYSVTYSPKTGVIEIKRDGVYIGSYTDPSPIQNGTTVMLMTNKMRARFDDVNVTLYKEEFPPAPPPVAAPTLYHTHTDHLGGSSVVTGGLSVYDSTFGATTAYTGTILQQLDQYPFGEERVNSKTAGSSFDTKKKFTGKELDSETGLYYYGARYYDTAIGRFVSEDPSFLTLSDSRSFTMPQGWNSYSYALNNPVKYTDPSGRDWYNPFSWDWESIGNSALQALDSAPISGDISDVYASHSGKTLFAQEELSPEDLGLTKAAALLPVLTGGQMRTGKKVANATGEVADKIAQKVSKVLKAGKIDEIANKTVIQFGKTENQIYHTFRHTDALGLKRSTVQSTIETHFKTVSSNVVHGKPFNQIIKIGDQRIQYTAFKLSDETFNIGKIYAVK